MGVILNCGKESLYISLLNWSNFKTLLTKLIIMQLVKPLHLYTLLNLKKSYHTNAIIFCMREIKFISSYIL